MLETVIENKTGIFFYQQHPDNIINAVESFEENISKFDHTMIRNNALRFSKNRFQKEFKDFVDKAVNTYLNNIKNNTESQLEEI